MYPSQPRLVRSTCARPASLPGRVAHFVFKLLGRERVSQQVGVRAHGGPRTTPCSHHRWSRGRGARARAHSARTHTQTRTSLCSHSDTSQRAYTSMKQALPHLISALNVRACARAHVLARVCAFASAYVRVHRLPPPAVVSPRSARLSSREHAVASPSYGLSAPWLLPARRHAHQ